MAYINTTSKMYKSLIFIELYYFLNHMLIMYVELCKSIATPDQNMYVI